MERFRLKMTAQEQKGARTGEAGRRRAREKPPETQALSVARWRTSWPLPSFGDDERSCHKHVRAGFTGT